MSNPSGRGGHLRAALLTEPGHLEMGGQDEPEIAPGHVLVQVRTVGVCGTDLSIFTGRIPVAYPRVLGHEMTGVVLSGTTGPGTDLPRGRRVVVDPNVACGACYQCLHDQQNLCTRGALLGRDRDGGFRDLVAVPATNVHPIPDELGDRVGPLIQVLTTCVHAHRRADIFPGDSVVVLGLGVTGLLHIQLSRARGARPVIGITRRRSKLDLARRLGADLAVPADDPDIRDQVLDATEGRGADVVIECVGRVATLADAIGLVRVGGRVVVYGTITETDGALPFYDLYYKELSIQNTRAAKPQDFPVAIDMAATGTVQLDPLITGTFGLEEIANAFVALERPDALKVIVEV